jgi:hypothetical protein
LVFLAVFQTKFEVVHGLVPPPSPPEPTTTGLNVWLPLELLEEPHVQISVEHVSLLG